MIRTKHVWAPVLLALILPSGLKAVESPWTGVEVSQWRMTLRVLEGIKEGATEPAKAVTSSYLRHILTASIPSGDELAEERNQIRKIFNLKDVRLMTEADLSWGRSEAKASHVFRLDGQEYSVFISTVTVSGRQPFRIQVFERNGGGKTSLLDTGFGLPENARNLVVFGFENTRGTPYFLSLHAILFKSQAAGPGPGGATAGGTVETPTLLNRIDPVYPDAARQAKVEGIVILEATIDVRGRVQDVKVLRSIPLLDQAAVDAVKQWVYEPMIIDGRAVKAVFTVTVRFVLDKDKKKDEGVAGGVEGGIEGGVEGGVAGGVQGGVRSEEFEKKLKAFEAGAIPCKDEINPPKLLKLVDPVYPPDAKQKGIEGIVIVAAKTDESGKVIDAMILRSIPGLDQAALDSVRQWVYEPLVIDGKPRKVIFTVTVRFVLN
jgi:TonB family protein